QLNAVTVKDSYPLPRVADRLSRLEGATIFSSMDLQSGYHQVPVASKDRPKTAFVTADGLYQFRALPFGLTNAPATFQRAMDIILTGLLWTTCLVYLDDVIVYSATFEQHLEQLQSEYIKSIGPDPEKLEAVENFPSPAVGHSTANKVKRVQSFLGLCSYYRRHIQNFAAIARPLTSLTKKDIPFIWGTDQVSSFNALKAALTSAPVLAHPNYDLPMEILPDTCGFGIGVVLAQRIDGVERPVAYASRLLSRSETNYSITEKEGLALVWCLTKFRCFVWGCQVKVITDHQGLCLLMSKRDLTGRLARTSLPLQEYDITIVYRSGKTHDNDDCLSINPLQQIEEMEDDRCFIVAAIGPNAVDILSPEENGSFIRKQRAHRDWSEKISKLEDGKERVKNFILCNGKLYKETFKDGKNYRKLCVPVECRERILQAY
ncbi:Uncharacterized protein APZ42_009485, partial [Daphnia magna]